MKNELLSHELASSNLLRRTEELKPVERLVVRLLILELLREFAQGAAIVFLRTGQGGEVT